MPIRFKFKRFERPDGTFSYSPVIPVTLVGNGVHLDATALIDSGADFCVVPIEIAEILNLDLSKPEEDTSGVGGIVKSWLS